MNLKYKFFIIAASVSMAGCAAHSNQAEYRSALQKAADSKITSIMGSTGYPLPISSNGALTGSSRYSSKCQNQTPKGYDFSVYSGLQKEHVEFLSALKNGGYIRFGSPYMCQYKSSWGNGDKTVKMIPVSITNDKEARFVHHTTSEILGTETYGILSVGHFYVTKITSATHPHFNSQYSMKTVAVTGDIGLRGIARLGNDNFMLKSLEEKNHISENQIRNSIITISAILGESSGDHWKPLKITHFSFAKNLTKNN